MTYLPCTETVLTVPVEGRSFAETPFNIFQHTIHFDARDDSPAVKTAKKLCAGCPRREACLLAGAGEFGVWGGTTSGERKRLGLGGVA
jgi:hypothetical protein